MKLKVESSTQLVELLQVEKEMNFKFELRQHRLILSFLKVHRFQALIKSEPCCYVLYTSSMHPSRKRTL